MNVRLRWPGTLLLAVLLAGCASPSARFYTLAGSPPIESSAGPSVAVGPITIPAVVDRPEIVVTLGSNEVWPDEFNRWASPLTDAIGLVLVQDLSADLPSPRVTLASATSAHPEFRVAVEVQRFESRLGSDALLDAAWTVRRTRDGAMREGRTTWREPATGDTSYDALAAAHSRALRGLARNLTDAINALRAPVAATPSPAR